GRTRAFPSTPIGRRSCWCAKKRNRLPGVKSAIPVNGSGHKPARVTMQIQVSNQPGRVPVTIFHIVGDIDTHTYLQLEAEAREAHAAGARNIVLDLAHVGYVSSAGIRAINAIYNLLRTEEPAESDEAVRRGRKAGTHTW